jgi:hypothetical protein
VGPVAETTEPAHDFFGRGNRLPRLCVTCTTNTSIVFAEQGPPSTRDGSVEGEQHEETLWGKNAGGRRGRGWRAPRVRRAGPGGRQHAVAGIKVEPIAKIKATGAAVEITVTYECPAGFPAWPPTYVFLDVNQAVFGGVAKGAGSLEVRCTGKPETVSLTPIAQDKPFRWGSAWVRANLTTFPDAKDERTVTILP